MEKRILLRVSYSYQEKESYLVSLAGWLTVNLHRCPPLQHARGLLQQETNV